MIEIEKTEPYSWNIGKHEAYCALNSFMLSRNTFGKVVYDEKYNSPCLCLSYLKLVAKDMHIYDKLNFFTDHDEVYISKV